MAIGATIAAAAVAASIPYVIEGIKYAWNESGDSGLEDADINLTAQNAEQARLYDAQAGGIQEQIERAKGATGMAIGANIAGQAGRGTAGLSGVSLAQSQQGELMASGRIGDLNQDLLNLQVNRHNDLMAGAQANVTNILGQHGSRNARGDLLGSYKDAATTDAEREFYRNAAQQYG